MSGVMNKNFKVLLLVVFVLTCTSFVFAQTSVDEEQMSAAQIQELIRIQKQEIRQAAKVFFGG
ncbi:MAG: hypothetical protein LRZ88_06655 [Candidatus Cloacimonetes bacterium]|nr:hypothetical protein [Candidatus Cloacimonadota bacterium]